MKRHALFAHFLPGIQAFASEQMPRHSDLTGLLASQATAIDHTGDSHPRIDSAIDPWEQLLMTDGRTWYLVASSLCSAGERRNKF